MPDRQHEEKHDYRVWILDKLPERHDDPLHTWYALVLAAFVIVGIVLLWRYGA